MESIYLKAEEEVRRRRRRLNVLKGIRVGLTISLGLTAFYGVLWAFGLWGPKPPSAGLLLLGNALGAGLGALWGRRLRLSLPEDLYRVDRALGLEERLVTIYELRRRGAEGLLRALYRQLDDLRGRLGSENIRRALSLPPTERGAWLGTAALGLLSLGFLGLWMAGFGPLSWDKLLSGAPLSEIVNVKAPGPLPSPDANPPLDERRREDENPERISQSQRSGETLTAEERRDLCRRDRASQTSLTEEQWSELCEGQDGNVSPSDETERTGRASQAQTVGQALQQLLDRLVSGEISDEEARSELQSLMEQIPPGELREALERAAQAADEQELRERIQDALSQLARNLPPGSDADSESMPESGESASQRQEQADSQTQSTSDTTSSVESQGSGENESSGSPDPAPSSTSNSNSPSSEGAGDSQAPETAEEKGDSSDPLSEESSNAEAGESQASASRSGEGDSSATGESSDGSGEGGEETSGEGSQSETQAQSTSGGTGSESGTDATEDAQSGEESAPQGQEGEAGEGDETARSGSGEGSKSPNSESDSETEGDSDSHRSGSGVGTGEGPDASESPPPLWTNLNDGLLIQSGALPRDAQLLNRLFAKGLPVDLAGQGEDGAPRVVLNLARFESLLEARDLPPELRALVRAYFLAIAEGPSPSQNTTQEKGEKP